MGTLGGDAHAQLALVACRRADDAGSELDSQLARQASGANSSLDCGLVELEMAAADIRGALVVAMKGTWGSGVLAGWWAERIGAMGRCFSPNILEMASDFGTH